MPALKRIPVAIFILVVLLAANTIWFTYNIRSGESTNAGNSTSSNIASDYPLLASRIFVDNPNDVIVNFSGLRQKLRQELSAQQYNYSFYFEYLPSGTSIKINQDTQMVGASLLKVPLVMNLLKAAEQNKIDLNKTLTIQEGDIDRRSGTLWQRGAGTKLSAEEVAKQAITQSDNTAVNMLIAASSNRFDLFQQSIDELDINLSVENETQTTLGAQSYSSVLKCLYLSCFLSYQHSQQILGWLTETESPARLRGGIPDNIKVAHKYGTSGGRSESDCGIVYIPKRPYIICFMIDAPPEEANKIISSFSKTVYDYTSNLR